MARTKTTRSRLKRRQKEAPSTFLQHVQELQLRLFAVALVFLAIAGAAFPFFDNIVAILLAPLSSDQELVYLTPGGAFTFMMQVCLYVGLIGSLPVIIYHLYRFIMPAVQQVVFRRAVLYTVASFALALVGIFFAYAVSLPAALYFLTGFDLYHINPMLTIDSYLSFIMTYILAGALLFQLPLLIMIINSVTPLKPSKLMSFQPKMLLGSFIVAAIISPTPDVVNQALLALPVVAMYQLGIVMVLIKNRKKKVPVAAPVKVDSVRLPDTNIAPKPTVNEPIGTRVLAAALPVEQPVSINRPVASRHRSVDGIKAPPRNYVARPSVVSQRSAQIVRGSSRIGLVNQRPVSSVSASLDGIITRSYT